MRKGVLSTILVIQLVLLTMITFNSLHVDRNVFSVEHQIQKISAIRVASTFLNAQEDMRYLYSLNATDSSVESYLHFVETTFPELYFIEIQINETHILITDDVFEMSKRGEI